MFAKIFRFNPKNITITQRQNGLKNADTNGILKTLKMTKTTVHGIKRRLSFEKSLSPKSAKIIPQAKYEKKAGNWFERDEGRRNVLQIPGISTSYKTERTYRIEIMTIHLLPPPKFS